MRNRNSCSLCGGIDHNKRTCMGMFKDQDEVAVAQDEVVQEKDTSSDGLLPNGILQLMLKPPDYRISFSLELLTEE
ncbi:hypothetical protein Tco_0624770 [Tanacetum coccineum]|uniref:Uncharacterized protein n=1 Tax=Tanacetum coccineum TaxID=301880 RepID=A0ABQ4WEV8_9ASTR